MTDEKELFPNFLTTAQYHFQTFIAVKHIWHKIHQINHFQLYISGALSTFILFSNHGHHLSPEFSIDPNWISIPSNKTKQKHLFISLPQAHGTHQSTLCPYDLTALGPHGSGITQCLSCDWLIALSIMSPGFTHDVAGDRISFLSRAEEHPWYV